MNQKEAIEFELGFDIYRYDGVIPEEAGMLLLDGWRAAKLQFGKSRLKSNIYVRKWLQLRTNACYRGKYFDECIDASYISNINVPNCPVTGVELTVAQGLDTDWSVDRAVNDHGYVASNLLVMSVYANQAKADKPFHEISLIAESDNLFSHPESVYDGLTQDEWQRMRDAILPATTLVLDQEPIQYLTGQTWLPGQPYGSPAILQALLTMLVVDPESTSDSEKREESRQLVALLFTLMDERVPTKQARRCVKRMGTHFTNKCTVANGWSYWANPRPARLFVEMWVSLDRKTRSYMKEQFLDPFNLENGFKDDVLADV